MLSLGLSRAIRIFTALTGRVMAKLRNCTLLSCGYSGDENWESPCRGAQYDKLGLGLVK